MTPNVVILAIRLLATQEVELTYSVTNDSTNCAPTGYVSAINQSTKGAMARQFSWMNATNVMRFAVPPNTGAQFFRLNWVQSTNFDATFTYTSSCPREVSIYCAGNLGRYTMTNGQTFNIAAAYGGMNGQLPCGQTVYVRDYASSELLVTATFPYPCDRNEYRLTGGWSLCP